MFILIEAGKNSFLWLFYLSAMISALFLTRKIDKWHYFPILSDASYVQSEF